MRIGSVAARYTDALFEIARDKGVVDAVANDVAALGREVEDPRVRSFLLSARVPLAEKAQRLQAFQGSFHELTYNFIRLLLDKRRLDVLPELAPAFRRRQLAEQGTVQGVVESPRPLGQDQIDSLADALGRKLGKTVLLEGRVVPELVGGARIFVQNRMIDHSVQGRLHELEQRMRRAPLPTA